MFEYKLSLNRVRDRLKVIEGDEELLLTVNADAARMVTALTNAQKELKGLTNDSTDEERTAVAKNFAAAIFGGEQADKLLDFYHGDALCVVDVCGRYFAQRLSKLISNVQKRMI